MKLYDVNLKFKAALETRYGISSLSNPVAFRFKMAHKIVEINQILDKISISREKKETYSLVDDSIVVGRISDKSKILEVLTNSNVSREESYSVVRIVGIGGVGKTTLAQLVFCAELVTNHFDIKSWVCVSQHSNEKEVFSNLFESMLVIYQA